MLRTRAFFFCVATAVAISGAVAACGGDDTVVPTGNSDGGTDGTAHVDGAADAGNDTAPADGGGGDGGDGGPCDFNAFVTDLIKNHTNSTEQPSVDLGQNCVDTKTPFPATLFQ